MATDGLAWAVMLARLGYEVYRSAKAGENKTVREIFEAVSLDLAEIERLEALAAAHYPAAP